MQLRFLEQFLRGVDTGITREPPDPAGDPPATRRATAGATRTSGRWRAREWTEWHLDAADRRPGDDAPGGDERGHATTPTRRRRRRTPRSPPAPFEHDTEITGPVKLRLWVSSSSDDADLFAIVRKLGRDGREVTFPGPMPGGSPIAVAYGWLRASHRKLDPDRARRPGGRSTPTTSSRSCSPARSFRVEIEIWPTSVVVERGERLVLEVGAKDDPQSFFQHDDPRDRARTGTNTIHTGGTFDSHLLLPIIPAPRSGR